MTPAVSKAILIALTTALGTTSGCFRAAEARGNIDYLYTEESSEALSDLQRTVSPGQFLLSDTAVVQTANGWQLGRTLEATIPGTFGIPFHVRIEPCLLAPAYSVDATVAFVAPRGAVSATHDGTSVLGTNDELGIRVENDRSAWLYCDNGTYNGVPHGYAIWKRRLSQEEWDSFTPSKVSRPRIREWSRTLAYGGVAGGKLTLIYQELKARGQSITVSSERDFVFDIAANGPTEVSVWGSRLRIESATSTEIRFQVLKGFD